MKLINFLLHRFSKQTLVVPITTTKIYMLFLLYLYSGKIKNKSQNLNSANLGYEIKWFLMKRKFRE